MPDFRPSLLVKTDRIQAVLTRMDAGSGNGVLRIYEGTIPTNTETAIGAQVLLAEFTMEDPSGALVGLTLVMAVPDPAVVVADGHADFCRYVNAAGDVVFDSAVSLPGGTEAVKLSALDLEVGGLVEFVSGTLA